MTIFENMEIGKYLIYQCSYLGEAVGSYKASLLLYCSLIEHYKLTRTLLFFEPFTAKLQGPIMLPLYIEYSAWGSMPIVLIDEYSGNIDSQARISINIALNRYLLFSVGKLIEMICYHNSPWDIIYRNGQGDGNKISPEIIVASL